LPENKFTRKKKVVFLENGCPTNPNKILSKLNFVSFNFFRIFAKKITNSFEQPHVENFFTGIPYSRKK